MTEKQINPQTASSRLEIGLGTELQLEIANITVRFKSELIGVETNKYLAARMPTVIDDSFEEKCSKNKGAAIICRYLYKGKIFGFHSNLISIISEPVRLLFFNYPNRVEEHNVRKHERASCLLPCKIKIESLILDGTILDLSLSGTLISVNEANQEKRENLIATLADTNVFDFLLQLPGEPKAFLIKVIRKDVKRDGSSLNIGVQFCDIGKEVLRKISCFIDAAKAIESL